MHSNDASHVYPRARRQQGEERARERERENMKE